MSTYNWFDCSSPRLVRNRYTHDLIQVPCGRCPSCLSRRLSRWVPAIARERECWKYCIFFTLTYKDKFLPTINIYNYEVDKPYQNDFDRYKVMSKKFIDLHHGNIPIAPSVDIQKFLKRFRENIFRKFGLRGAFRYFISSDYGSTLFRPHWHGLLFFSSSDIRNNIGSLLSKSWSVTDKVNGFSESIGKIEFDDAYGAGQYVAAYIHSDSDRPSIYQFRDFRARSYHSSAPAFGSLIRMQETLDDVVRDGKTEITVYDPITYEYKLQPLTPNIVRRLFPTLPSFDSLAKSERMEIYRFLATGLEQERERRIERFISTLFVNDFLNDYVTLGSHVLTYDQVVSKLDRLYYIFKRFHYQSLIFGVGYSDYDDFISKYRFNVKQNALRKQFLFESLAARNGLSNQVINQLVDVGYSKNKRGVPSFVGNSESLHEVDRCSFDVDYFASSVQRYNKLIKRKCDNAYLEKHPEFKQFHS